MQSAVLATAIPSVCPSVTRWCPIQTNEDRITRSSLWSSKRTLVLIFVQNTDLTISSSVWRTSRQSTRHLHCGTTTFVLSIQAQLELAQSSPCSVPTTPEWTTCTTPSSRVILYLQCTSDMPARRYLIVQFPSDTMANFCELEVYIRRKSIHRQIVVSHQSYKNFKEATLANGVIVDCKYVVSVA